MTRVHGTLTKWNDERGFGFITLPQGGPELFVHISEFPRGRTRPTIGELISFEISSNGGKQRATRVHRAGGRTDTRAQPSGSRLGWGSMVLFVAAVCVCLVYAYERYATTEVSARPAITETPQPLASPFVRAEPANFSCDGRNSCSQMTSCDEATYFLQHCPGAKMDGDHDGIPCEQQWCTT